MRHFSAGDDEADHFDAGEVTFIAGGDGRSVQGAGTTRPRTPRAPDRPGLRTAPSGGDPPGHVAYRSGRYRSGSTQAPSRWIAK